MSERAFDDDAPASHSQASPCGVIDHNLDAIVVFPGHLKLGAGTTNQHRGSHAHRRTPRRQRLV
jgi:hypothetical protein